MEKCKPDKNAGHRKRLREKFFKSGLSGFHEYEIIELLLTIGTPRKDCKETAKEALQRFKTLHGVIEASKEELLTVKGIGPKNIIGIRLVKEVADRYLERKLQGKDPIHNSKDLFKYLYHRLRDHDRECFTAVFLDAKNKVITSDILFQGTLTESSVYPREVVKAALDRKAAAMIFAHNHPSGDPQPSQQDIAITQKLLFSCRVMGITVHEHLIIGDNRYFSFADQGIISKMNREFEKNNQ